MEKFTVINFAELRLRFVYILFFLLFYALDASSQINLVRNGSFEDHSACPNNQDQLPLCDYWVKANTCTVDYVCACSPDSNFGVQAPYYFMGYQQPFHGQCYMGIGVYYDLGPGTGDLLISEYIQTALSAPLIAMFEYKIRFYTTLANHSEITIDNFGALISEGKPDQFPGCGIFDSIPQMKVQNLTDTLNWIMVEKIFIAKGGENWLTIGRFDDNGLANIMLVPADFSPQPPVRHSYYLVDSVSLIQLTSAENLPEFPNVFSPNNDGVNDIFQFPDYYFFSVTGMKIFNRWGIEVVEINRQNPLWNGKDFQGNELSPGVYFYSFYGITPEGKTRNKNGTITLFR